MDAYPHADAACLGLTFKANVTDMRESPALEIALALARRYGSRVNIVEPYVNELPNAFAGTQARLTMLDDALESCEIAIVLVEHDQFKSVPTFNRRHMAVLDARGIWRDMPSMARRPSIDAICRQLKALSDTDPHVAPEALMKAS
jgi:UDP-N-acetyl-D-mannosaminuronic acid dehydrogenase